MHDCRVLKSTDLKRPLRLAYGLIPFFNAIEKRGIATSGILEAVGIPYDSLMSPQYLITYDQEIEVLNSMLKHVFEPHISLELATKTDFKKFSVLGLAMQACSTVREMGAIFHRYPKLSWASSEFVEMETSDGMITRALPEPSQGLCERFLKERDIASALGFNRIATKQLLSFREVRFAFPKPKNIKPYLDYFLSEVYFDREHTEVLFDDSLGDVEIPGACALTKKFYEAQCLEQSDAIPDSISFSSMVRNYLLNIPVQSVEKTAEHYRITTRTLQRRLANEGATYSGLVKDIRTNRAKDLLKNPTFSIEDIADRAGFSDAVSFSHAFKQWTSLSPGQWRKEKH
jgi:AraC-like DNA-binding protein